MQLRLCPPTKVGLAKHKAALQLIFPCIMNPAQGPEYLHCSMLGCSDSLDLSSVCRAVKLESTQSASFCRPWRALLADWIRRPICLGSEAMTEKISSARAVAKRLPSDLRTGVNSDTSGVSGPPYMRTASSALPCPQLLQGYFCIIGVDLSKNVQLSKPNLYEFGETGGSSCQFHFRLTCLSGLYEFAIQVH